MYKICEHCGAHLDYGEMCDCESSMQERGWIQNTFGSYVPNTPENNQELRSANHDKRTKNTRNQ